MPAGMWIKNLVYIQGGDKAIIFKNQFKNAKEISTLLGWERIYAPELKLQHENIKNTSAVTGVFKIGYQITFDDLLMNSILSKHFPPAQGRVSRFSYQVSSQQGTLLPLW